MLPKRLLTQIILLLATFWNPLICSATDCQQQPDFNCLIQFINDQKVQMESSGVSITTLAHEHWMYEAEKQYAVADHKTDDNHLTHSLRQEDMFINNLQSNNLAAAEQALVKLQQPFHDLFAANGYQLLIEKLTLQLQDGKAEQIKRSQLEQVLQIGTTPNATLILLARHEILGGAPGKGIATLRNTRVDEFSDIVLYSEQQSVLELGETAKGLFLNPVAAKKNCKEDNQAILDSMADYFSIAHQNLLKSLWNTPTLSQAWKNHLILGLLYQNAGACPLFVNLHTAHVIQSALTRSINSEQDFVNLLQLASAIRRYFIF